MVNGRRSDRLGGCRCVLCSSGPAISAPLGVNAVLFVPGAGLGSRAVPAPLRSHRQAVARRRGESGARCPGCDSTPLSECLGADVHFARPCRHNERRFGARAAPFSPRAWQPGHVEPFPAARGRRSDGRVLAGRSSFAVHPCRQSSAGASAEYSRQCLGRGTGGAD